MGGRSPPPIRQLLEESQEFVAMATAELRQGSEPFFTDRPAHRVPERARCVAPEGYEDLSSEVCHRLTILPRRR